MNIQNNEDRIDEISTYYSSADNVDRAITIIFWITAALSLLLICPSKLILPFQNIIKVIFIILVTCYFLLSVSLSLYLIPLAERKRRKQLLSDAFNTPLIQEKTNYYYNNEFVPSISRLGANVMENSFFSMNIASRMLIQTRWIVGIYLLIWFSMLTIRGSNLDTLLIITQTIFSSSIAIRWLQLEFLKYRHDQTYEALYSHYLSGNRGTAKSDATILDAFAQYETTKATSGRILSSKIFNKINNELTIKWNNTRSELKMID